MTPVVFIICVFSSVIFSAFIWAVWEKKYQDKMDKQKELESKFDFDQQNEKVFGDLLRKKIEEQ